MPRYAKRIDNNQKVIVSALREIHGVTVAVDHDDILVGWKGNNYWYEIKNPDRAINKGTGTLKEYEKQSSQKKLESNWTGHYKLVWNIDQILEDLGISV